MQMTTLMEFVEPTKIEWVQEDLWGLGSLMLKK